MRLRKLHIGRFKSIKNENFIINNFTALVGPNNSGKSNILDALDVFFNPNNHNRLGDYLQGPNRGSYRIDCAFENLTKGLRKEFPRVLLDNNGILWIRLQYKPTEKDFFYHILKKGKKTNLVTLKKSLRKKFFNYIGYEKIPAIRDLKTELIGEETYLQRLLKIWYESCYKDRDNLKARFRKATSYAKEHLLSKIGKNWTELLHIGGNEVKVDLDLSLKPSSIFSNVEVRIQEKRQDDFFPPGAIGTGYQGQLLLALTRCIIDESEKNTIIGFEEPEAHLHPQAQEQLMKKLKTSLELKNKEGQILITTHSRDVVDSLDLNELIIIRKNETETHSSQLQEKFLEEVEENKILKHFHIKNNEVFFSKGVILVEGITDKVSMSSLIERYMIEKYCKNKIYNLALSGISILEFGGGSSLYNPIKALENLNIPYFVIVDRDKIQKFKRSDNDKAKKDNRGFKKYKNEFGKILEIFKNLKRISASEEKELHLAMKKNSILKLNKVLLRRNLFTMKEDLEAELITRSNLENIREVCPDFKNKKFNKCLSKRKSIKSNIKDICKVLEKSKLSTNLQKLLNELCSFVLKCNN